MGLGARYGSGLRLSSRHFTEGSLVAEIMIPGAATPTEGPDSRPSNPLYRMAMAMPYAILAGLIALLIYCHVKGEPFNVSKEDGLIEWGTVVAFGLCGAIALTAALTNRSRLSKAQMILIILVGLVAFAAVGEELSWGQRYFGFTPPEGMKSDEGGTVYMGHNDTTGHNLSVELGPWHFSLFGWSFDIGPLKFSLGGMLFGVPLMVVIVFHGIWLPLRVRAAKPKSTSFTRKLGLFLPPIHLAVLLLAGTILFHYSGKVWKDNTEAREFKELLVPAVYAFMLLHAYFRDRNAINTVVTGAAVVLLLGGFALSVMAVL